MGGIFIEPYVKLEYLLFLALVGFAGIFPLLPKEWKSRTYLSAASFTMWITLAILYAGSAFATVPLAALAFLQLWIVARQERGLRNRWIVSVSFLLFMFFVSSLLRIEATSITSGPNLFLVGSIYDDEAPAGVSLLFASAIVLYGKYAVLTFSFQYVVILVILAYLIPENFYLIWRIVHAGDGTRSGTRIRGLSTPTLSGSVVALSCQCEGIVAAAPAISSLLVGILVLPLIGEAVILVLVGNILFLGALKNRSGLIIILLRIASGVRIPSVALLVITMTVSFLGALLGLEYSIFYFYGLALVMYFGGFLGGFSAIHPVLRDSNRPGAGFALLALSMVSMLAWFFPFFSALAFNKFLIYLVMDLASILGGLAGGIGLILVGKRLSGIYMETVAMMFPLLGLFIFYYSVVSPNPIWPQFSLLSQFTFAVVMTELAIPILWLVTVASILGYHIRVGDVHGATA